MPTTIDNTSRCSRTSGSSSSKPLFARSGRTLPIWPVRIPTPEVHGAAARPRHRDSSSNQPPRHQHILATIPIVGALTLAIAMTALPGACAKSTDCAVGSENCSCTSASVCEAGLKCLSNVCVSSDGSGSTPGGSTGGQGLPTTAPGGLPGNQLAPLPPNTFVFVKLFSRGTERAAHLFSYDLTSRVQRLISKLDDDVGRGDEITGLTVAPGRRWVTFSSRSFRLSAPEIAAGFPTAAVWSVSVDGKLYARMTPPLLEGAGSGRSCSTTSNCTGAENCQRGRCLLPSFRISVTSPVWAPDGNTLYFSLLNSWLITEYFPAPSITFGGGINLASISSGNLDVHANAACQDSGHAAIHPNGKSLAMLNRVCTGRLEDGLHEWTVAPPTHARLLLRQRSTGSEPLAFATEPPLWVPNGIGVLFVAGRSWNEAGERYRYGLHGWDAATGQVVTIFGPTDDTTNVEAFTLVPDGARPRVIMAMAIGSPPSFDLYELNIDTKQLEPLTTDGINHAPRW